MARLLIVVAALAACRDKDAPPPAAAPPPPPSVASGAAAAPPAAPRPAPALAPIDGADSRALPPEQAFAAEKEDPAWATATEKQLRGKLTKLPGAKIECRQYHCAITLAGDESALARDVDQLNALSDSGATLVLTRPSDGEIRAYLRFTRAED